MLYEVPPRKGKNSEVVHSNTWRSFLKMWDQITYYIVPKVSSLPGRRANKQGFQQERKTATRQMRGRMRDKKMNSCNHALGLQAEFTRNSPHPSLSISRVIGRNSQGIHLTHHCQYLVLSEISQSSHS
jgi:hypothetical protein